MIKNVKTATAFLNDHLIYLKRLIENKKTEAFEDVVDQMQVVMLLVNDFDAETITDEDYINYSEMVRDIMKPALVRKYGIV